MIVRKITFWLTLLLIFTIPWEDTFTFNVGIGSSFTRLLGFGVAGFWFLTIVVQGRMNKPRLFHALVLFFFAWSMLTYLWTANMEEGMYRIKTYAQIYILLMIVWEMLQKPEELKAGMQAYILGAFVPIVSSINNYLHGTVAESFEGRYSATGVNAVDLALFLLLGLPMAWYLFNYTFKKASFLRWINLAYIPAAVFAVLLTASRTSLFAVIPAVVYIAWPKRLDAGRIVASVLLLIVSIIVLQAVLPASVIERLSSVTTSISNADIGGRVNLWIETVGVFTQHPLFGSGSASLPTLIGALSHETYLSVLAETGLVGFILFGIVLIFVFLETMRLPKGYIGLWFSTFCIWLIGVLSLSFEFRKITWLLFSFMIIQGYSLRNQWQADKERQQISESEEKDSSGNRLIPIDLQNFSGDQRSSL